MFYTIKERILLFLKCMIIILLVGLLFDFIFNDGRYDLVTKLAIATGCSIGISINDLMFGRKFSSMFSIIKSDASKVNENEKDKLVVYSYLSIIMGVISVPAFALVLMGFLGLFYGMVGLKSSRKTIAKIGLIISIIGLVLSAIFYASIIVHNLRH